MTEVDLSDDSPRNRTWFAPAVFAALCMAMFGDVLLSSGWILSSGEADLAIHFAASREFGFGELAKGNVALWNPQMFSGYPYFGGFQPALLYPPNWIHLLLPLPVAINLTIVLHTFAAGYFTYLWLRGLGLHRISAVAGGVMFMFCARLFLHIYAGHLPHICLMPWVPLLLWSIDGLTRRSRLGYALVGACALAMMILAGYPQMVYYTAVVMPLYVLVRWVAAERKWLSLAGLAIIGLLACGMAAAQLLAGVDAIAESTRAGGTAYGFSTSFSFPPENLLTLIAPDALGPIRRGEAPIGYFGQAYLWEVSTYVGATAVLLAVVAIASRRRDAMLALAMVLLAGILGLGANTPLHRICFDWLPGFSSFRGSSKFFFLVSLFIAQLAAIGLDALFHARLPRRSWVIAASLLPVVLAMAFWVRGSRDDSNSLVGRSMVRMTERAIVFHDDYFKLAQWNDPQTLYHAATATSWALFKSSIWLAAGVALLAFAMKWPRRAGGAIACLLTIELFVFARTHRATIQLPTPEPPTWAQAAAAIDPSTRLVRNPSTYPLTPGRRLLDAWGYDPGVLKRYAELMYAGQGFDPEGASSQLFFRIPSRAIFMLARIGLVLEAVPEPRAHALPTPSLPPAVLVPAVRVMPSRDDMLGVLVSEGFDPGYTALVETPPPVVIAGRTPLPVNMKMVDTDTREVECNLASSGMLVIGESYSEHWIVRPQAPPPPGQTGGYAVMPVDWAFIGIPLAAGRHHFLLEYAPWGWRVGRWVSLGSVCVMIGLVFVTARRAVKLRASQPGSDGSSVKR